MLVPFVPPVISCFSLRFNSLFSAKTSAVLLLSLGTLTACGGSDSTEPTPTPKDTIAPVITLNGESPLTLSAGTPYAETGATANDATDGNVDVTMTGSVDSTIVNSYTLTYTATDTAGNKSTSTRIVNVIDDVAPVITLGGSSEVIHPVGTAYIDASATASDNVDEVINVITSDDVKADAIGSYTVTYTAKDEAENEATAVVRTVIVADLTAPVITLNGDAVIEHEYGTPYSDAGATAVDNIDGNVAATTTDTILINDTVGSYGITYKAEDTAGNTSTLERIVNVVDTVGPVITLTGGNTITLGQGRDYQELGATALDNLDGEIAVGAPTGTVDYDAIGIYQLTYTVEDSSKNVTTLVRTVEVVVPKPFITTWKTDNGGSSADNEITITTNTTEFPTGYNYTVDWGDDTTPTTHTGDFTYTYATAGTYTVTISGDFPQLYFPNNSLDNRKLLTVEQWGDGALLSLHRAFAFCYNVVVNATDIPNLRFVTDMSGMFESARSFDQDISTWDVSSVLNMSGMFLEAEIFNQDISAWDVSSVTDMSNMFNVADFFNQNIGVWDVSSVTDMSYMFNYARSFNQDISGWDVSKVTNMERMFHVAYVFNQDINTWDVSSVTDMNYMFAATPDGSSFNGNISSWDVSSVTNMRAMFSLASAFNQNISGWNVSSVTTMRDMFNNATLSTANYDALLSSWSGKLLQSNVDFDAGDSQYSPSSQTAKDILTSAPNNWTITDGGVTP